MQTDSQEGYLPILMYHSIAHSTNARIRPWTVPPEAFAEQMAYLREQSYTPLTVTQLVRMRTLKTAPLPARPVVITFDDAFADFFTEALPVLKKYDLCATLYVPTAYVGGTGGWLVQEGEASTPILTWEQLKEVSASGIECGAHSHSHPQLDTLAAAVVYEEITRSKKLLEDHLGQEVSSFAYPYGYSTAAIRRMVQEAGFLSACSVTATLSAAGDDLFALPRLRVDPDLTLAEFAVLLTDASTCRKTVMQQVYRRFRSAVDRQIRRSLVHAARWSTPLAKKTKTVNP